MGSVESLKFLNTSTRKFEENPRSPWSNQRFKVTIHKLGPDMRACIKPKIKLCMDMMNSKHSLSNLMIKNHANLKRKQKKKKSHQHRSGNNIDNHTTLKLKIPKEKPVSHHCVLKPKDLVDGLRILKRVGGHFYPGRLTEISPPDIYGIVVDKERGNKPHIFSQEEVLNEVVLEIKPKDTHELKDGTRVCAFSSNQINYLHPGTVAGPDVDENYVIIQLDDGDSRDIHIDQVRYLPEDYPLVVSADESVTGLFGARKRASSSQSSENWKKKRVEHERGTSEDNNGKDKNKKKKRKDYEWSVCVKEISPEDQGKEETFYKQ